MRLEKNLGTGKSLRVVLVIPQPPLPLGGAASRWHYVLLRGLVERGHRVTAFAASSTSQVSEALDLFPSPRFDLRLFPHATRRGWLQRLASARQPSSYLFSRELRDSLSSALENGFDILHLDELWSGWLGLRVVDRAVLNIHNLYATDLAGLRSMPAWRYRMTASAERRLLRRYPTITTLTPRLSAEVRRIHPKATVNTIPVGLPLARYLFVTPGQGARLTVGLIGSYSWAPTFSAAERLLDRLWPAIHKQMPHVRLHLVGRRARTVMATRTLDDEVSVMEDVADIEPYFRELDVLLFAPSHATGMKIKVLEAMAFGLAVVTNRDGVEGLPAEDGIHAGVAEDDEGLVERTVLLLKSVEKRAQQAAAARALVEQHCSGDAAVDATVAHYQTMLSNAHHPKR